MPLTDSSKVRFNYTDNSSAAQYFDLPKPIFGYDTTIAMPIDFSYQDDGSVTAYDSGPDAALDVRQCRCDLFLTETEQALLMRVTDDTKARARNIGLELSTGSGFFPFGADIGDSGTFTVSVQITNPGSIGMAPLRHFKNTVLLTMIDKPVYSIPADESLVGPVTIGSIENIKFPDVWFQAGQGFKTKTSIMNGGTSVYLNRGASGDAYSTSFELRMRNARCARLLEYLTGSGRADALSGMDLIVPNGCYPFGRNKATGGTFNTKLIQDTLQIKHVGFQQFNMTLNLALVA